MSQPFVNSAKSILPTKRDSAETDTLDELPPPELSGYQRDPEEVTPGEVYQPSWPVWVYRDEAWRRGVVMASGPLGVLVHYQATGRGGEVTDTVTATHIAPRAAEAGG